MEYKENSFKLYTEIKGLIVTYKEACQQMVDENNKIIVITGPTATGKTDLSVKLCKEIDGEVISADSMQIYKKI